jgi:hypothetical protein
MKLTSHYFAKHMEGHYGISTQNFYLIFESDFDSVFFFTFTMTLPLAGTLIGQ